jgi:hypothetical protein
LLLFVPLVNSHRATAEQKKDYKYFDKIAEKIMESPPGYRVSEIEALQAAASAETDLARAKMLLREWTGKGYLEFVSWIKPYAVIVKLAGE